MTPTALTSILVASREAAKSALEKARDAAVAPPPVVDPAEVDRIIASLPSALADAMVSIDHKSYPTMTARVFSWDPRSRPAAALYASVHARLHKAGVVATVVQDGAKDTMDILVKSLWDAAERGQRAACLADLEVEWMLRAGDAARAGEVQGALRLWLVEGRLAEERYWLGPNGWWLRGVAEMVEEAARELGLPQVAQEAAKAQPQGQAKGKR